MDVRIATEADLAAVQEIADTSPGAPHWSVAHLRAYLPLETFAGPGGVRRVLLCAFDGEMVAGFAAGTLLTVTAEAELESIAVRESARRGGVGRLLLLSLMDWARVEGAHVMRLEVRRGNLAALRLYESAGFLKAGERRAYYSGPVEDAVLMERGLR